MGRLTDFIAYLDERAALVTQVEHRLCQLQQKYESYFAELQRVREDELQQLAQLIVADRRRRRGGPAADAAEPLPDWLDRALTETEAAVEREFGEKLGRLTGERDTLLEHAETARRESAAAERRVREKNVTLDTAEEQLKQRRANLEAQIADYNRRIRQLGHGWGFFANLFRMRRLAAERRKLDEQQADLAARIDGLRARWADEETEFSNAEAQLRQQWVELSSKAAALQAQIDALEQARPRIVLRSTTERVLFEHVAPPAEPAAGDPPCPRCEVANPTTNHFCRICAQRLHQDRPDLSGSIAEIGEINHHHARFAEGLRACQQIIGLVRGILSGLKAFRLSVADVLSSERRYPLPPLRIDVPPTSVSYGSVFDRLDQSLRSDYTLHPAVFARQVQPLVDEVFTEDKIKAYFETMGEELSRQASAQW